MTILWDNPRPDGYWPGTPTQWREPSVDDCTWYATEFLFERASSTHLSMHPTREIREHSSDKVGGTPLAVALRDTLRLWPTSEQVTYRYGAYSGRYISEALRHGAGILWGGDYEQLPKHYRRWTNNDNFDHAFASLTLNKSPGGEDRTFLYDPLGGGPQREFYDGEWITLEALFKFNWQANASTYYVGIVENKGKYRMQSLHLPITEEPDRVVTVRRGGAARAAPRYTADPVRKFWNEDKRWRLLGKVTGGWHIVLWKVGDNHWEYGYVFKDDILTNEGVVIAGPVESDPDESEAIAELHARLQTANKSIIALKDDKLALINTNYAQGQLLKTYEEVVPRVRDDLATLP